MQQPPSQPLNLPLEPPLPLVDGADLVIHWVRLVDGMPNENRFQLLDEVPIPAESSPLREFVKSCLVRYGRDIPDLYRNMTLDFIVSGIILVLCIYYLKVDLLPFDMDMEVSAIFAQMVDSPVKLFLQKNIEPLKLQGHLDRFNKNKEIVLIGCNISVKVVARTIGELSYMEENLSYNSKRNLSGYSHDQITAFNMQQYYRSQMLEACKSNDVAVNQSVIAGLQYQDRVPLYSRETPREIVELLTIFDPYTLDLNLDLTAFDNNFDPTTFDPTSNPFTSNPFTFNG